MKKIVLVLLCLMGCNEDKNGELGYECYSNNTCKDYSVCVHWNKRMYSSNPNDMVKSWTKMQTVCADPNTLGIGEYGEYEIIKKEKIFVKPKIK